MRSLRVTLRTATAVMLGTLGLLGVAAGSAAVGSYHRYSVPGYGTSLALPSSWKTINSRRQSYGRQS